jgi:hypothetical protein
MTLIRLDIGCGKNKRPADQLGPWIGVDKIKFEGVDVVCDVAVQGKWCFETNAFGENAYQAPGDWYWTLKDSSVDEIHCSHFLEHLTAVERCWFMNELHRIMKPGAKATIVTPHWASNRAYGDPTHQWPAVSEMFFYYLKRDWRDTQAPHTDKKHWPHGFDCDFDAVWGYNFHPALNVKNDEYKQFAMAWYKDAIFDIIATLTCRKDAPNPAASQPPTQPADASSSTASTASDGTSQSTAEK